MQYLVTVDYVDVAAPLSSQQTLQLVEEMVIPLLETCARLQTEGTILAGGVAARAGSATLIIEAQSNDQLSQLVQSLPGWGTLKVSVTPLQSFTERAAQDKQAVAQRRSASDHAQRAIHEHLGRLRDLAGK